VALQFPAIGSRQNLMPGRARPRHVQVVASIFQTSMRYFQQRNDTVLNNERP
jgi:hypothetical protein